MSKFIATLILTCITTAALHAAPREWRSNDGARTIRGEFLKRDATSVTIRRSTDFKDIIIPLDKLHPDDRTWLNTSHPLPGQEKPEIPDSSAVFDKLSFGETRAEVLAKLKTSKFVELTVDETFIGRTGLNDVFRTRRKIGGLDASLFFDWTDDGKLKEITLQTAGFPASELKESLTPCWKELAELMTTLYGKPIHADPELKLSSIQDGVMLPSHLWKLEKKGSATLGAARDGEKYQVVVRFTQKTVVPVAIP